MGAGARHSFWGKTKGQIPVSDAGWVVVQQGRPSEQMEQASVLVTQAFSWVLPSGVGCHAGLATSVPPLKFPHKMGESSVPLPLWLFGGDEPSLILAPPVLLPGRAGGLCTLAA